MGTDERISSLTISLHLVEPRGSKSLLHDSSALMKVTSTPLFERALGALQPLHRVEIEGRCSHGCNWVVANESVWRLFALWPSHSVS
jgi:hypothetical protein